MAKQLDFAAPGAIMGKETKEGETMKKFLILLLAAVCVTCLTGCFCIHKWQEADCLNPQTCQSCGKTKGGTVGHDWQDATCDTPRTCAVCGGTEGEALGHEWQDATTDAPRTCARCGLTEGERIITDPRFTTDACKELFGTWSCTVSVNGRDIGLDSYKEDIPCVCTYEFLNDGTMRITSQPENMDEFLQKVVAFYIDTMYDNFAATGISRQEADEAIQSIYGVSMEDFALSMLEELNIRELFGKPTPGVYYVADGKLYMGESWEEALAGRGFTLSGDTLIINEELYDVDVVTMTRVK